MPPVWPVPQEWSVGQWPNLHLQGWPLWWSWWSYWCPSRGTALGVAAPSLLPPTPLPSSAPSCFVLSSLDIKPCDHSKVANRSVGEMKAYLCSNPREQGYWGGTLTICGSLCVSLRHALIRGSAIAFDWELDTRHLIYRVRSFLRFGIFFRGIACKPCRSRSIFLVCMIQLLVLSQLLSTPMINYAQPLDILVENSKTYPVESVKETWSMLCQ